MSETSLDIRKQAAAWWPRVRQGLRVLRRGGLISLYWSTTYGDRGWELAGKGAAAWIGGTLLAALVGADGDLHLWNPFHVASAVLVVGGLGAFVSGLVREWRRFTGPSEGGRMALPASFLGVQPEELAQDVEHPAPQHPVFAPATPPEGAADGAIDTARSVQEGGSLLEVVQARKRRGGAGERYVGAVLGDLDRRLYKVTENMLLPADVLGRHVGDVDFLVQRRDAALAAVVEVKTTHPGVCVNGVAVGASHRRQAARLAWAVSELDEALSVFAFVVYVDPVDARDDRMKQLAPMTYDVDGLTVTTMGAKALKSVLQAQLQRPPS